MGPFGIMRFALYSAMLQWLAFASAAAAEPPPLTPEQQAALACMTPDARTRATLVYPEKALKFEDDGEITVDLTFNAADKAPKVNEIAGDRPTSGRLYRAVEEHVRQFRVPCLAAPVTLRQTYAFTLSNGLKIMKSQIRDARTDEFSVKQARSCLVHKEGLSQPTYPVSARRHDVQDIQVTRLTFTAPDAPPTVEFLASSSDSLRSATQAFLEGFRVPCLPPGQRTSWFLDFHYKLIEGDRVFINDMNLVTLLSGVKTTPPAQFDLDAMGCPFDVQITHFQPAMANLVNEVATTDPRRKPLLQWLSQLELKLDAKQRRLSLGRSFVVSIPCGKVDL